MTVNPIPDLEARRQRRRRRNRMLFGISLIVGAIVAFLVAGPHPGEALAWAREIALPWLERLPPGALLVAVAVLPALGCPVSPLYLLVGAHGPWVSGPGLALAVAANLSLSWVLARTILRPVLTALVARRGLRIPEILPANRLRVTALVRLTPGLPLFLQSTLLALAGVPFLPYLALSWLLQYPIALAMALLGDAFIHGGIGTAVAGAGLLIALLIGIRLLRQRLRDPAPVTPLPIP